MAAKPNEREDISRLWTEVSVLKSQNLDLKNDMREVKDDLKEVKDKLMNRLPLWATLLIASMTATIGGLVSIAFR